MRRGTSKSSNAARAISDSWKNLSSNERAIYFQKAVEDKFRYYREKEAYEEYTDRLKRESKTQDDANLIPEDWRLPKAAGRAGRKGDREDEPRPLYSSQAIALLASKLDQQSIDFLIKALKWAWIAASQRLLDSKVT